MMLLIVEDNKELSRLLNRISAGGFGALAVTTAGAACNAILVTQHAAFMLDLAPPDSDGLDLLRTVCNRVDPIPILVLNARGQFDDRVGSEATADDYLTKPLAVAELVARAKAHLGRSGELSGDTLALANISFDVQRQQLLIDDRLQIFSRRELAGNLPFSKSLCGAAVVW